MDNNLKKKYPIGAEYYTLYEEVGTGASASVYRALCIPLNEIIAIKILDFERSNVDLNNISREAQTMILLDHPNVLKSHCSFVTDHSLWVVMPYTSGGSCLHILKARHPDGFFEENVIATILREVLKGLNYVHQHGHIHRDVKAGNILIDSRGGIKLGDFGVSAYLFDAGDRQRMRNTFVGTPCWMAPEVMEQLHGYDFKADIWSFGITALELAHGHAPFSKYTPMKVLMMTLQNAPPSLDDERDKKFSKSFKEMIASCLVKDPSKRPSAKKLLKHSFFKQAKSNDYIAKTLLEGLPPLGVRVQSIKKKEEDMLAQKKMPDGEKEEISQNEYKRGISCWDFNLDDLKAEASLIQDDDFNLEKDEDSQAKQLHNLSSLSKNLQRQSSFAIRSSDAADSEDNTLESVPHIDTNVNIVSDSTKEQTTGCMRVGQNNQAGNYMSDVNEKLTDGEFTTSSQCEKVQNQSQNLPHTGATIPRTIDNAQPEIINGSKPTVNGEEIDEKAKNPVIQQKGRFKVTSENVEMEKGAPGPVLHKSVSLQVIPQNPAMSSLLSDAVPLPANPIYKLYPSLHSVLRANVLERDNILKAMKEVAAGEFSDAGPLPISSEVTEGSLLYMILKLEAAYNKEKDHLGLIIDSQLRFMSAQDELRKYKPDYQRG